jgi:hypothetical protein
MIRSGKLVLPAIIAGLLLVGCGGITMTDIRTLQQPLTNYQALYFSVRPDVGENIDDQMMKLEETVLKQINKRKLFDKVRLGNCIDSCSRAIIVTTTITEVNKVSGTARFFIGMFAGNATMTAEVVFVDALSGDTIGVYSITGKSGSSGFSGNTGSVTKGIAKKIVKLIEANSQKT